MQKVLLSALVLGLLALPDSGAAAQDDVRAIIVKAIQAHGGEAQLSKLTAEQTRAKGTIFLVGNNVPFTAETFVQLPSQFKNVMQFELQGKKGTLIQVLDGDKGWLSLDGKTQALEDKMLAETRETMYVQRLGRLLVLLQDRDLQLTALPEAKVNGQPALGIKVASKGHKDVYLFFDKASGLLVKTERRALDSAQKEVLQEELFSDYKEVNGVKRPLKLLVLQDGKKFMEGDLLEVKPVEKLPDNTFAKP